MARGQAAKKLVHCCASELPLGCCATPGLLLGCLGARGPGVEARHRTLAPLVGRATAALPARERVASAKAIVMWWGVSVGKEIDWKSTGARGRRKRLMYARLSPGQVTEMEIPGSGPTGL